MTTEWVVTAAAERYELTPQNTGEVTFTVTNPGPAQDRVVFEVVADERAGRAWFAVDEPQRPVPGGGSVSYLVKTAVPGGTAPGTYWMQGRAYSASTPPEETSRLSGRVTFEVRPVAKPSRPWWPYAAAAALVVVVLAVVGWLVLRPAGTPTAQPSPSTSPSPPSATVNLEAESLPASANAVAGPQADCCAVVWSNHAQLWFRATDAGQLVRMTFSVPVDGPYTVTMVLTKSYDYGNTTYTIDDRQIGGVFFGYSPTVAKTTWSVPGTVELAKGPHTLTLTVVGKSNVSKGFYAGIDQVRLVTGSASPAP
jgi:hypothetical protein